ncbi:hypothetical protein [Brevibacillus laterosporus]|uniref:hypothetical protein n=1 Tax=Brevibacillus laterosporus TaxID=1465 RepID=UPI002652E711|nr:hypothetical protein [Brevibacillus laterosporus]MDN9012190.1 hypothetical protein [Brevibacillus laterosporus]MDO0943286.1 hypothetical protein [Brevibacillus laterosporus]
MSKKHCKCRQRHHRHHHHHESQSGHHWENSSSSSSVWTNHEKFRKKCRHRHVTVILNPGETLVVHARHRGHKK